MSHPSKIGRYHVIGRIASGGMAEILLAKVLGPGGFERPVVIKRVLPHLVNQREFRDMFLDEARIVAAIHHHNVVQVHELGLEDDELYLVMEYLAGESVRSLAKRAVARNVPLDLGLCAHIIAEACAGLHAAHEFTGPDGKPLHVVHRDVCPNNLFVSYDGTVRVVDFGIAQAVDRHTLTEAGQVKGKAAYMSPEQCLRQPVDRRTDVFALGVVLYELSTGHRLFGGALESRILSCLQQEQVQTPSSVVRGYPPELEQICMRALRFDPAERFATAEDMRRELVRFQRGRAGDVLPEQQLKTCMHALFQDRIEEKADLLTRVRDGSGVSHIPTAEVSDEVSVPLVETDREAPHAKAAKASHEASFALTGSLSEYDVTRGPPRRAKSRERRWLVGAAIAACLIAGLGGFLFMTERAYGKRYPLSVRVAQVSTTKEPRQAVPQAAVPKQITVELTSQPPGAGAWIEQQYRGNTPLRLVLPRSAEPVKLRLELAGHDMLEQALVPDVDQRLSLSLSRQVPAEDASARERSAASELDSASEKSRRRRRAAKPTKGGEEFFLFE